MNNVSQAQKLMVALVCCIPVLVCSGKLRKARQPVVGVVVGSTPAAAAVVVVVAGQKKTVYAAVVSVGTSAVTGPEIEAAAVVEHNTVEAAAVVEVVQTLVELEQKPATAAVAAVAHMQTEVAH